MKNIFLVTLNNSEFSSNFNTFYQYLIYLNDFMKLLVTLFTQPRLLFVFSCYLRPLYPLAFYIFACFLFFQEFFCFFRKFPNENFIQSTGVDCCLCLGRSQIIQFVFRVLSLLKCQISFSLNPVLGIEQRPVALKWKDANILTVLWKNIKTW